MSQLNTFPGSDYIRNPTPSLGRALTQAPGLARNIAGMAGSAANAAVTYSGPTSQPIAGSPMLGGTQNNAAPMAAPNPTVTGGPAPAAGLPGMNGGAGPLGMKASPTAIPSGVAAPPARNMPQFGDDAIRAMYLGALHAHGGDHAKAAASFNEMGQVHGFDANKYLGDPKFHQGIAASQAPAPMRIGGAPGNNDQQSGLFDIPGRGRVVLDHGRMIGPALGPSMQPQASSPMAGPENAPLAVSHPMAPNPSSATPESPDLQGMSQDDRMHVMADRQATSRMNADQQGKAQAERRAAIAAAKTPQAQPQTPPMSEKERIAKINADSRQASAATGAKSREAVAQANAQWHTRAAEIAAGKATGGKAAADPTVPAVSRVLDSLVKSGAIDADKAMSILDEHIKGSQQPAQGGAGAGQHPLQAKAPEGGTVDANGVLHYQGRDYDAVNGEWVARK